MVLSDFQEQLCQYIAFHLPEDVLRQFEENVLIEHGELEDYIQRRFKFTKKIEFVLRCDVIRLMRLWQPYKKFVVVLK